MTTMVPIFPSSDFDRTAGFYRVLGLQEQGRWPGEYLIMTGFEGMELHFWAADGVDPSSNQCSCYARLGSGAEARALHGRWSALALPKGGRLTDPVETDYGLVEFGLVDPDGNLIRAGGPTTSQDPPDRSTGG